MLPRKNIRRRTNRVSHYTNSIQRHLRHTTQTPYNTTYVTLGTSYMSSTLHSPYRYHMTSRNISPHHITSCVAICNPHIISHQMEMMCNPPQPGEPSHALYKQEGDAIMASLANKARMITQAFNSMVCIRCISPSH